MCTGAERVLDAEEVPPHHERIVVAVGGGSMMPRSSP